MTVAGGSASGVAGGAERDGDLLEDVFVHAPVAILRVGVVDQHLDRILDANPAAGALLGRSSAELVGVPLAEVMPELVGRDLSDLDTSHALPRRDGATGATTWLAVSATALPDRHRTGESRALLILHDVTEQWRARARLDRQARHDPLTGLINRAELLDQLARVDPRTGGPHVAVVYLDLDGFKLVNDTRGHQVGDELLVAVARRIRAVVRPEDSLARLGGDEFVLLCPAITDHQQVRAIAERVRATLDEPVSIEGRSHRISMSVGIALSPVADLDPADLMRQADMAMYRAKDAGRNTVRIHSVEMDEELATAELISDALSAALSQPDAQAPDDGGIARQDDSGGLVLHFQPIVEIATGELAYVEALTRVQLADGALVYPSQFLPVAARAGLNGALSEYVLRRALAQRARWRSAGIDVAVGLNLARGQVYSASFAGDALRLIAAQGDVPQGVVFEMGEFGLLEPTGPAQLTLRRLRSSGIGLAIDHFGTGYSSLGALRFLGPHRVKIDRSFVASIVGSDADRAIVRAAVSAAHALGQRVVAEGVETREQLSVLTELGCDEAQGYLIARVLPADDLDLPTTTWAPGTLESRAAPH